MSQSASQAAQTPPRPQRDWVAIIVTALPGLAALIAIAFTFASVKTTQNQLEIARQGQTTAEQGQITDRYNAAITNLGSHSIEVRLGGIYALQRLMQDSPRDQRTVIAVLCAFVRDQSAATIKPGKPLARPPTDVQAALTVVGTRDAARDAPTTVLDLDHAHLTGADLAGTNLRHANLAGANLRGAHLGLANLRGATLIGANLGGAHLREAQLTGAELDGTDLTNADLSIAHLVGAFLHGANLTAAYLTGADLRGADLGLADLGGAWLRGAWLRGADLRGANLRFAHLRGAHLKGANLKGANLKGVKDLGTSPVP